MENLEQLVERRSDGTYVTLEQLRAYLDTLKPSLRLMEPDSTAFNHLYMFGHALSKGCCARAARESVPAVAQVAEDVPRPLQQQRP